MPSFDASTLETLSQRWNGPGRRHTRDVRRRLGEFHRGEIDDPGLPVDPRDEELATAVLDAIGWLHAEGRWSEARTLFDPAHEPFVSRMGRDGLDGAVALGPEEALFCVQGTSSGRHLWHVDGDQLTPHPDVFNAAISTDRSKLALLRGDGVKIYSGWRGVELGYFEPPRRSDLIPPWLPPDQHHLFEVGGGFAIQRLVVADTGRRVALATTAGVLVGDLDESGGTRWNVALPHPEAPPENMIDGMNSDDVVLFYADMVHVALSPDGRFLACGTQDEGHHIFEVAEDGTIELWATLGYQSEYPHDACFSDDARHVAFNACHFYNGSTFAADVAAVEGARSEPWVDDPLTTEINGYLRVYASTWLSGPALGRQQGAFALAGAGALTIVTPSGDVVSELLFGSSAGGLDYCPKSGTLVLASYSGFLHFLDPSAVDEHACGWNPPAEHHRWCFFGGMDPFRW